MIRGGVLSPVLRGLECDGDGEVERYEHGEGADRDEGGCPPVDLTGVVIHLTSEGSEPAWGRRGSGSDLVAGQTTCSFVPQSCQ